MAIIGVLEGSLRTASLSRAVARDVASLAPKDVKVTILPNSGSVHHFNQDILDEGLPASMSKLADAILAVDALLIITPEYNWSISGVLKNAIDWLSRVLSGALAHKPVAIWTVSPGLLGGTRAHESIRHVLHSQDVRIMAKPEIQVGGAKTKIDVEIGKVTHPETVQILRAHLVTFNAFIRSYKAPAQCVARTRHQQRHTEQDLETN